MAPRDDDHAPTRDPGAEPDRAAILARRNRFIAIALSGLTTVSCGVAVNPDGGGDAIVQPEACLRIAPDTGPEACLSPPLDVVEPFDVPADDGISPQPCLSKQIDSGNG